MGSWPSITCYWISSVNQHPFHGEKGNGICLSLLNCFPYGAVFGAMDVPLLGQMEMDDVCSLFTGFPVGVSVG